MIPILIKLHLLLLLLYFMLFIFIFTLSDFGVSRALSEDDNSMTSEMGTPLCTNIYPQFSVFLTYLSNLNLINVKTKDMAPEVITQTHYDQRVDIFSFSMTLFEMLFGKHFMMEFSGLLYIFQTPICCY